MIFLTLTLLAAVCAGILWAGRPRTMPRHLRHRWIEREINSVIRRRPS